MTLTADRPHQPPSRVAGDERAGSGPATASPHGHDGATLEASQTRPADGDATPCASALAQAVTQLDAAITALGNVDVAGETDAAIRAAAVALPRQLNRAHAQLVDVIAALDTRGAYQADGAVTAAAWYRTRTHTNPGHASRLVTAARRLPDLPELAAAFANGRVSIAHTTAITSAAVPGRRAAIRALETTLVTLAEHAPPRDVRAALATIRDLNDADGSDVDPLPDDGMDARRTLNLTTTIDGLCHLHGLLDPVTGEWLHTLLDAFHPHDTTHTADTAEDAEDAEDAEPQRRSPTQQRHDALHQLLTTVAAHPDTPTRHHARPHVIAMIDLDTLAGVDHHPTRPPTLRYAGHLTANRARQLARDARITAVQTMGPWRPVNLGRSHRTLPAWLRDVLHLIHRTCRGPDCDRPATWTDAHHLDAWHADHGDTNLNRTVPLCRAHHQLITTGNWHVDYHPDTRTCTWTTPTGRTITTHPPP